ncbi:MAG: single-stranded DNA-binding protein [Sarcina sp.]|nr:single-stranded DNA-binding protein [Sarcina sp.]
MNRSLLIGRLTRNPAVWNSHTGQAKPVAKFTLAVDRRFKKEGGQSADFIPCVAFGKLAEHVEKYYHKGLKIAIIGHIQTGSYENKDGQRVYTVEVVADELEFAESKALSQKSGSGYSGNNSDWNSIFDDFEKMPEGEALPFT